MKVDEITLKLHKLPDHLMPEVADYIDFLLNKHGQKEGGQEVAPNARKFTFNWENGLTELKTKYSSVELQHKVSEWRR